MEKAFDAYSGLERGLRCHLLNEYLTYNCELLGCFTADPQDVLLMLLEEQHHAEIKWFVEMYKKVYSLVFSAEYSKLFADPIDEVWHATMRVMLGSDFDLDDLDFAILPEYY